jgi:hypothetical protein
LRSRANRPRRHLFQNDNVNTDGAYASFCAAARTVTRDLLGHVGALLDWPRDHDVSVIHNHIAPFPGRRSVGSNAPIFTMVGPESLKLDSWGA